METIKFNILMYDDVFHMFRNRRFIFRKTVYI